MIEWKGEIHLPMSRGPTDISISNRAFNRGVTVYTSFLSGPILYTSDDTRAWGLVANWMISKTKKPKREMAVRLLKQVYRSIGTRIDLPT